MDRLIAVVLLTSCPFAMAGATVIVRDDFSDGDSTRSPAWDAGTSKAWSVEKNPGTGESMLRVDERGGDGIAVDLGSLAVNTVVTATVRLRSSTPSSKGYEFNLALYDSASGDGYMARCANYGNVYAGTSGFVIYDTRGRNRVGVRGKHLYTNSTKWQTLTFVLDTRTESMILVWEGEVVAEWTHLHQDLDKVDRFVLSTSNWGAPARFVDDVVVVGTRE